MRLGCSTLLALASSLGTTIRAVVIETMAALDVDDVRLLQPQLRARRSNPGREGVQHNYNHPSPLIV